MSGYMLFRSRLDVVKAC